MTQPLDFYASGIAAAFATRLLLTSHAGPLLRVRRSSDSAELDVGADGSGALDTAALLAFAGAGSAYVVSLYDQKGGAAATAPTSAAQPPLVVSGVLQTMGEDGLPAPLFNGTAHVLRCDAIAATFSGTSVPVAATAIARDMGASTGERYAVSVSRNVASASYFLVGTLVDSGPSVRNWAARRKLDTSTNTIMRNSRPAPGGDVFTGAYSGSAMAATLGIAHRSGAGPAGASTLDRAAVGAFVSNATSSYWNGPLAGAVFWSTAPDDARAMNAALAAALGVYGLRAAPLNGAWTWFNSPEAVQVGGRTYVGAIDGAGDIQVGAYEGGTHLGTVLLDSFFQIDDHNNPAVTADPSGLLLGSWSVHNGTGYTSRAASDWRRWTPRAATPGDTRAYAVLEYLADEGAHHLFYRESEDLEYRTWSRIKSTDGGATWGTPVAVIDGASGPDRPYPQFCGDGLGRIHVQHTDGHPVERDDNNIYYCYYDGGSWYGAAGNLLRADAALPLTIGEVDKVYDSVAAGTIGWTWDTWAHPTTGRPVLAFAAITPDGSDHRYHVSRWTGSAWATAEVCAAGAGLFDTEPYYSGGIAIYDDATVFVSRQISGQWEIWRYDRSGETWSGTAITAGSSVKNIRPVVPRVPAAPGTAAGELFYLTGRYTTFTDYDMTVVRLAVAAGEVGQDPDPDPATHSVLIPAAGGGLLMLTPTT